MSDACVSGMIVAVYSSDVVETCVFETEPSRDFSKTCLEESRAETGVAGVFSCRDIANLPATISRCRRRDNYTSSIGYR